MSCWPQEDIRHQASFSCYDHQEPQKVFYLWSPGRKGFLTDTDSSCSIDPLEYSHNVCLYAWYSSELNWATHCRLENQKLSWQQWERLRGMFGARSGFIIFGRSCFLLIFTTSRCWMTKTFAGDFERVTIKARREWSHLSAPCPWGWTMAGTRFSLTCRTSPGGLMEPIT